MVILVWIPYLSSLRSGEFRQKLERKCCFLVSFFNLWRTGKRRNSKLLLLSSVFKKCQNFATLLITCMYCLMVGPSSSCSQLLNYIRIDLKYIGSNSCLRCVSAVLAIGMQYDYVERICYRLSIMGEEDEEDSKENCFIKLLTSMMVKFWGTLLVSVIASLFMSWTLRILPSFSSISSKTHPV